MLLRTENVGKQFNGVYALKNVDFEIAEGEIHGLVGENGAGKSTLIKILTGVYAPDEGDIYLNNEKIHISDPSVSRSTGINVIHQDHVLIPAFNAVENVYLGMEYPRRNGFVDWKLMKKKVRDKADELGIGIDPDKAARDLTPPQKTCLEIIRAMMTDCRLLILDEPTASLTDREAGILFRIISALKARGTSILYVTHRLDEIFELTDRVTVLRNGVKAGVFRTADVSRGELIAAMTESWTAEKISRGAANGPVRLEVSHLASGDGIVRDVSFAAAGGEIFGIFGLGGSGRTELLECIYGYRPAKGGSVRLSGRELENRSPACSIRSGMILISEDRRGKALVENMCLRENISLSGIDRFIRAGFLSRSREKEESLKQISALNIKSEGTEQRVAELSGGNQQKTVFAKALMTDPDIFLCDEPTQAVDVVTRSEIHKLLRALSDRGGTVIFVSSDIKEMLDVADRIMVMSQGCTVALLKNDDLTSNELLGYCYDG